MTIFGHLLTADEFLVVNLLSFWAGAWLNNKHLLNQAKKKQKKYGNVS